MKTGAALAFAALGLGFVFANSRGAAGTSLGPSETIEIKAGETWMITVKAVNGALGDADEAQIRAMAPSFGTLQSLARMPDGSMIVAVITYAKATKIITNQLIALTSAPDRGVVITEAKPLPAGGPEAV